MKRTSRIALTTLAGATSVAVVLGLVVLGSASEGPLSTLLSHIGTGVSELESGLVRTVRGPGRSARLAGIEGLRQSRDSLRRPDTLLLGAYDERIPGSLEGVLDLEDSLGVTFPIVQAFTAWGDAPEHRFPERIVEAIHGLGSIPLITWEPWLTTFASLAHPELPLPASRDRDGLTSIARGEYDFYIDAWAREAARFGEPMLLRFAHEMNDPYRYPWGPQNNGPAEFIEAWRHVVDRFRAGGATNVLWVWSPHVAYAGYETYWPGDDYVDWVATGALNYGTVAYWSQWWSFEQIFGRHYDFLAGFGKPIMVAEFGSLAVGGDRAEWYRDALEDLDTRFPALRAILFFHVGADATVTRQAVRWSFLDEPEVIEIVKQALIGY